jgi:hypothetical protein
MQVNGAGTPGASTRQGNPGVTRRPKQGSGHVKRGAHLAYEVVWRHEVAHGGGVDGQFPCLPVIGDLGPGLRNYFVEGEDVV